MKAVRILWLVCWLLAGATATGCGQSPTARETVGKSSEALIPQPGINGNLEGVSPSAVVSGWVFDAGASSQSIWAHLYLDGPYPAGVFITGVLANIPRPDVNSDYGITGNHGFSVTLPTWVRDGKPHKLYVYGVSSATGANALINNSGLQFQLADAATTCTASDLSSLKTCLQHIESYDRISITANISCSGTACCGPNDTMLEIFGQQNKTIEGNGRTITRTENQRLCMALKLSQSSNLVVRNLTFDEDANDLPCEVADGCKETLYLNNAHHTTIDNVRFLNGKSYVVYLWATDHFKFINSRIENAGIIGLFAGYMGYVPSRPELDAPSHHLTITGSTFIGARTNAIALEGVRGTVAIPNLVKDNVIRSNHHTGLWGPPVCNFGICPGGQVYLADVDHLSFQNNTVADGYCENCWNQVVHAIEIGKMNKPFLLNNAKIENNLLANNNGAGFFLNSSIDATVQINGNSVLNNKNPHPDTGDGNIHMAAGETDGSTKAVPNVFKASQRINNFENGSDFPGDWTQWNLCSPGSSIVRWCPGTAEAMEQSCSLRMMTSSFTCGGLAGVWTQGMYNPIGPNMPIYLNTWSRNGPWTGQACLVFLNSSFTMLGHSCVSQNLDTWKFDADPMVSATTPAGTAYFAVKLGAMSSSGFVDVDLVRVAW
jgi:hypothetical protein